MSRAQQKAIEENMFAGEATGFSRLLSVVNGRNFQVDSSNMSRVIVTIEHCDGKASSEILCLNNSQTFCSLDAASPRLQNAQKSRPALSQTDSMVSTNRSNTNGEHRNVHFEKEQLWTSTPKTAKSVRASNYAQYSENDVRKIWVREAFCECGHSHYCPIVKTVNQSESPRTQSKGVINETQVSNSENLSKYIVHERKMVADRQRQGPKPSALNEITEPRNGLSKQGEPGETLHTTASSAVRKPMETSASVEGHNHQMADESNRSSTETSGHIKSSSLKRVSNDDGDTLPKKLKSNSQSQPEESFRRSGVYAGIKASGEHFSTDEVNETSQQLVRSEGVDGSKNGVANSAHVTRRHTTLLVSCCCSCAHLPPMNESTDDGNDILNGCNRTIGQSRNISNVERYHQMADESSGSSIETTGNILNEVADFSTDEEDELPRRVKKSVQSKNGAKNTLPLTCPRANESTDDDEPFNDESQLPGHLSNVGQVNRQNREEVRISNGETNCNIRLQCHEMHANEQEEEEATGNTTENTAKNTSTNDVSQVRRSSRLQGKMSNTESSMKGKVVNTKCDVRYRYR